MNIKELPKSELVIMNIIWEYRGRASSRAIAQKAEKIKGWKRTTTLTLLSRLVEKGILEREKKLNLSYYTVKVEKEEYKLYATKSLLKELFNDSIEDLRKVLEQIENQ
ncbi:MAG: BlaI/MecI/CopY family transcriptional regulator [Clostridium sp.]|jgi:predicted transcriptional regulator